jgi:hypothetical protein
MEAAPPEYSDATRSFLDQHAADYGVLVIPVLFQPGMDNHIFFAYVRLDTITNSLTARRVR